MAKKPWFEVDREGLAALVASKGKVFILHELLQNAWDCAGVSMVDVLMEPVKGKSLVKLVVTDDDPDGFKDLTHAYTLFASSSKKGDPLWRGRFNLGEKLVLALCESARITSTKGTIIFGKNGRTRSSRRRGYGTSFEAVVRMTREEYEEALWNLRQVIPYVATTVNGVRLPGLELVDQFTLPLHTVKSEADGVMRQLLRQARVTLYRPAGGEVPMLYEMGIPVVELGGGEPWHIDVGQKIPLSMERDGVTPGYLRALRVGVLDHVSEFLSSEQARAPWVLSAMGATGISERVVRTVVERRFGDKVVSADPSDREGEKIAVSQGYTVVAGGTFPGEVWDNIRRAGALQPAGQVTPSPKPFSPEGDALMSLFPPLKIKEIATGVSTG